MESSLCQPDQKKSCGACCGLYNFQDHSRVTLHSMLQKRTWLFKSTPDKLEIESFRRQLKELEQPPPLVKDIYNCEFLGFIDEGHKRVGCLLHPALHQGIDLRQYSFYGAELCAGHFCLSYTHLTEIEKLAVWEALDDWYLYGLVITDLDLVKEFFREVQARLGDCMRPGKFRKDQVRKALSAFFGLKENWPFAAKENRLGKYYFSQGEYQIARLAYEKRWQIKPSQFDKILVSLASEFSSKEDVLEAESLIEQKISAFIEAYLDE
ncbi:MAG: hypothetical protein ACPL5I_09935 [Thermodesulfobacteriota bacterium]